ncbi:MAG: carbohydrate kinase family protein [Planctomycetes bacterium]|nr:carbohydrate kinase family protein [Planctomycetota bacterium]
MNPTRSHPAAAAAAALESVRAPLSALIGFDGFIDSIIHMVDTRHDMGPRGYTRLSTIVAFAARCAAASGKSTNIEQVLIEERFGGNGPLMGGATAMLGMPTTYIGAVADDSGGVHPVFKPFAARCREVVPICPPSYTHCLEFDDGKLMFNNTAAVQKATWEAVVAKVGMDRLVAMFDEARLVGIVNWSLLGGVEGIWRGMMRDVLPRLSKASRRVFIDLSDPAKRSDGDIAGAMKTLAELEEQPGISITLGLNLAESQRLAAVVGVSAYHQDATQSEAVTRAAAAIRAKLGVDCVVIHPREGAGAADSAGHAAWFDGPFTPTPKLSTGAGDHFNAGFAFAQVHGLALEQCLATACAVSGAYVRDAQSPTMGRLTGFLKSLAE